MTGTGSVALRSLIDQYKATRSAWEEDVTAHGSPVHEAMVKASDRLTYALNKLAGNPDVVGADDQPAAAGVLDDDGTVYLVVDNGWGQGPCIEAFLPARPIDVVEIGE